MTSRRSGSTPRPPARKSPAVRGRAASPPQTAGRKPATDPGASGIAADATQLAAAKAVSVGHFLLRAGRLWNEEAIARIRAGGFPTARLSHTQVMPHLDLEGTRLTELARRMDVTKQAAQELINELEQLGVVERVPDPSDGRAKLIRFSEQGRRALLHGLDVLGAIEGEVRRELGDRAVNELGEALAKLAGFLEQFAARRAQSHPDESSGAPSKKDEPPEKQPPRRSKHSK